MWAGKHPFMMAITAAATVVNDKDVIEDTVGFTRKPNRKVLRIYKVTYKQTSEQELL